MESLIEKERDAPRFSNCALEERIHLICTYVERWLVLRRSTSLWPVDHDDC